MQTNASLIISEIKNAITLHTKDTIIPNLIEKKYFDTKNILTNVFGLPLYDLRIEMYAFLDMIDEIFGYKRKIKMLDSNNGFITYEIKLRKNNTAYLFIMNFFQYFYETEVELSILDD